MTAPHAELKLVDVIARLVPMGPSVSHEEAERRFATLRDLRDLLPRDAALYNCAMLLARNAIEWDLTNVAMVLIFAGHINKQEILAAYSRHVQEHGLPMMRRG